MSKKKRKTNDSQIMKRKLRASEEWKKLREKTKEEQKVDPITLRPLTRSFNLHHLDMSDVNYCNLEDSSHFVGLNSKSHTTIHFLYEIVKREGDFAVMDRIKEILAEMLLLNKEEE